PNN
ncbi:hypothetical protein VC87395_001578B, partial [Vibrio paracholerae 87395]